MRSNEGRFEVALGHLTSEVEEVEDVGVLAELAGKVRVRGGQLTSEVHRQGTDPLARADRDLVGEDVAGPAVLGGSGGVPVATLPAGRPRPC